MPFRAAVLLGAFFLCAALVQVSFAEKDTYQLRSAIELLEANGARVHRNGQVQIDIVIHAPGKKDQVSHTKLPTTYTLNVMEMPSTAENLDAIMVLPEVDSLYLGSGFERTTEAWDTLVKLGELKNLYVIDDLTDADFPRLAEFAELDMLAIRLGNFSPSSLWYLETMYRLESLSLTVEGAIEGDYFRHMPRLAELRHLELSLLTEESLSLEGIENLPTLTSLEIHAQTFSGMNLKPIGLLSNLERLSLSEVDFTSTDLDMFPQLKKLEHLSLFRCELPTTDTDQLTQLGNLRRVDLNQVPLTNAMLADLTGLPQLSHLYVQDAPLTDACLRTLAQSASLKTVRLSGTRITPEGVAWLRKARPDLNFSVSDGF